MSLMISEKDMQHGTQELSVHSGGMKTLFVYGNEANIMIATRSANYHSKPHRHDCEQLNYVAEGEMWIFIEEEGFHLKKGDFLRIPRNKLHWAWNTGTEPCVLFQAHAPVLSPTTRKNTVGLFAPGEAPAINASPPQESVDIDVTAIERRAMGTAKT
jgi:mannose-6-phosphate isomerase-like protein (cupin superfamily)